MGKKKEKERDKKKREKKVKKRLSAEKLIIGRLDRADFPEWKLYDVPCKTDTGAQTSAIHCHSVMLTERDGVRQISFKLLDPSHPNYNDKTYYTENFQERKIKNSFGQTEHRYVITTDIVLFGQSFHTEFTLADRENMKFPILLGRKLLARKFLVDVAKVNLSFKNKVKLTKHAQHSSIVER